LSWWREQTHIHWTSWTEYSSSIHMGQHKLEHKHGAQLPSAGAHSKLAESRDILRRKIWLVWPSKSDSDSDSERFIHNKETWF
jgi:hypothetical protein